MKRALLLNFCLVVILAATGMVGCRKKPMGPTPIPAGGGRMSDGSGMYPPEEVGTFSDPNDVRGSNVPTGADGTVPLPEDESGFARDEGFFRDVIVYFEFDRSTVRSGERSKIERVSDHLKGNPTHKLRIEGHCDERGTEGYNLALGERRALSVRDYLINLGISPDRIFTTSFGESRPVEFGQNEQAWAANRRAEFILLLPKQ